MSFPFPVNPAAGAEDDRYRRAADWSAAPTPRSPPGAFSRRRSRDGETLDRSLFARLGAALFFRSMSSMSKSSSLLRQWHRYLSRSPFNALRCSDRQFYLRPASTRLAVRRGYATVSAAELQFGQPVHETHPHILKPGECAYTCGCCLAQWN